MRQNETLPFEVLDIRSPVLFLSGRLNLKASSTLNSVIDLIELDADPDINPDPLILY
jgi:hypothetical protein